jgi:hypothetical protein
MSARSVKQPAQANSGLRPPGRHSHSQPPNDYKSVGFAGEPACTPGLFRPRVK